MAERIVIAEEGDEVKRYCLKEKDESTFLCSEDSLNGEVFGFFCPFMGFNPNAPFPRRCGSWCPLFDIIDWNKIPQAGGSYKVYRRVKLHCGAGTRVIDIKEEAKG
jgi:hypothetical protein